jgi:Leucine-rich repeat (LRR) protein
MTFESMNADKLLDLKGRQLSSLPESVGERTDIQRVEPGSESSNVRSESIGYLTRLRSLSLYNNQLHSLPESVWQLQTCRY